MKDKRTKTELRAALDDADARLAGMEEEVEVLGEKYRKMTAHAVSLLRAVQAHRLAERGLYAACAEVDRLPDIANHHVDAAGKFWAQMFGKGGLGSWAPDCCEGALTESMKATR